MILIIIRNEPCKWPSIHKTKYFFESKPLPVLIFIITTRNTNTGWQNPLSSPLINGVYSLGLTASVQDYPEAWRVLIPNLPIR